MPSYRALPLLGGPIDRLELLPGRHRASAEDPAISMLSDLRNGAVVVVQPEDRAEQVLQLLVRAGVRMGFVGDVRQGLGAIRGVVTAGDLAGEHMTQAALKHGLAHADVLVEQVMSPLSAWPVLEIGSLRRATVGDVAATLQAAGRRYLVVTEPIDGQQVLCGVFSASRIEQSLGTAVPPSLRSQSFAELHSALQHS